MEYNRIHYKVFRQVKGNWKWIKSFYNYREAYYDEESKEPNFFRKIRNQLRMKS